MPNPTNPTAVALRSVGALDFEKGFTSEQITLLKDAIAKEATDAELQMFTYVCQRKKLDPFAKQIYPVKRWDSTLGRNVTAYQTGIDGFRVIAKRSGKYRGQVGPYWCGEDGKWTDVWLSKTPPAAAKVGVKHADFEDPVWGIATWASYVQTTKDGRPNSMWAKMGDNQLAKCAESLALRKAFPEDLSGLYTDEEMHQADGEGTTPHDDKAARLASLNKKPEPKEVASEVVDPKAAPVEEPPVAQGPHLVAQRATVAPEPDPDWGAYVPTSINAAPGFDPLGDYAIKTTGKLAGKALKGVPRAELEAFVKHMREWSKKNNTPLTGASLEDVSRVEDYLRVTAPSEDFGPSL